MLVLSLFGVNGFVVGYVLGAVFGPFFAVAHRYSQEKSRKHPRFVNHVSRSRLVSTSVVAGVAIALVHAWFIATELAKR